MKLGRKASSKMYTGKKGQEWETKLEEHQIVTLARRISASRRKRVRTGKLLVRTIA